MRTLFLRSVIILVTAIASTAFAANTKPKEPLRISHGEQVTLTDYQTPGKYTIFDFYSDYCPPCRALKPTLERIHAEHDDVVLVVVDINRAETKGIDWKSPVSKQYNLHSIPHLVILDPTGKLVAEDHDQSPDAREYIEQHWSK